MIQQLSKSEKFKEYLETIKSKISPISLLGLTDVGKSLICAATKKNIKGPICILTYNEIQAKKIVSDLNYFTDNVKLMPKKEIVTYDYLAESKDLLYERIDLLNGTYEGKIDIIVTTIEAAMQPMISNDVLYKNILKFKVGKSYSLEKIKQSLVGLGYQRMDLIEAKGQFSVRGDILDIAISDKKGARIEFWGDEVDSIRIFNILSQRSTENIEKIEIYPAHEYVLEKNIKDTIEDISSRYENVEEDIEAISSGEYISKIDKYLDSFYSKTATFLEYLSNNTIIFIDEESKIRARTANILYDNSIVIKTLLEKQRIVPDVLMNMKSYEKLQDICKSQIIYLEKQDIGFNRKNAFSFTFREINLFKSNAMFLLEELESGLKSNKKIVIFSGNEKNIEKIIELLNQNNISHNYQEKLKDIEKEEVVITKGVLSSGFECYDIDLKVLTDDNLFYKETKRKRVSSVFKQGEKVVFADLKVGDYIVHKTHGIGQFIGVNTIKADGVVKDYIKIRYKDDDILYVPTNSLDNIRKYIGEGESSPKINRLGSKEWANTKAKVKNNLREVARNLIELYAKRQKAKGYAYSKDTPWQKQFEDTFPYVETEDQLRCIDEVKKDMEKQKPMDRLLCGDVGYGKTEVAIRAAFKACMEQKQVAYLVPTTVLANQQYECFKERMEEFPIHVEVLNRFRTKKEQTDIIKKLKLGEVDVVIGTHRMLSKDVEFKDLGLLIIDEEHRFGVKDKEKIKELKTNVDVLTMTATPIPRTLHMSIVGVRDMSVIYEPPQNRKPVQTYILEYDEEVIKEAILKELERGGQVFYLYNKVDTIIRKAEAIADLVPEAKVGFAHGKMSGNELEEIMMDFVDKKIDVLVCTTILESGIDIPNANTIIVENADRLGLAQLYQIRGRVGRSKEQAYAYITYRRDKLITEVADKRLKAIKEFTEFGSGFKIAMRDLEIRGAGSLLGEIQHGHMNQVGYDTYCKLLDEVVKEIQGEEISEEVDVQIDLNVSSYLPDEYIENSSQKIEMYQNIALCRTEEEIREVIDEMIDRFGEMPKEVENLLEITRIKELAKKSGVIKILQKGQNIVFNFDISLFHMDMVDELVKKYKNKIRFSPAAEPYITLKLNNTIDKEVIRETKEFLKTIK